MLPEFPSAARVSEYVCDLERLFSGMPLSSYGPTEPHLWLVSKIPTHTWDDCCSTSERKSRTHTYDDLSDLLIKLALPIWKSSSRHTWVLVPPLPLNVAKEKGLKVQPTPTRVVVELGGNLRAMSEVKPETGAPPLFYCKPVNDDGGPCHALDCDHRSGCVLQVKRQQHTKDGKTVTHHDHFRCTITCGYCGKPCHYEDECRIKKRESDKHKRQEAQRQKLQTPTRTPQNGNKGGKEEGKGGGKVGTPNPQRRSSSPGTSPSPAAADSKKRPQGDNASPEGSKSKKRHLAWMAKSLMAAGVDVKFPAED